MPFGRLGSVENIPTVCTDDLPTILGSFKNDPKSRSVNNGFQATGFGPKQYIFFGQHSAQSNKHRHIKHRDFQALSEG